MQFYPNATYTHCSSHKLCLTAMDACNLPLILKMFDIFDEVSGFFCSAKRTFVLDRCVELLYAEDDKKPQPLRNDQHQPKEARPKACRRVKRLCPTRWTSRIQSTNAIIKLLPAVLQALQELENDSDSATSNKAEYFVFNMKKYSFLVSVYLARDIPDRTATLTETLQSENLDFVEAMAGVALMLIALKKDRENLERTFSTVYAEILKVAEYLGVEESMARLADRQTQRDNPDVETPMEYYGITVYAVFMDQMIASVETLFGSGVKLAAKIGRLIRFYMREDDTNLSDLLDQYAALLPSAGAFKHEYRMWKMKWEDVDSDLLPRNIVTAFNACDGNVYPTIRTLLHILSVLPVSVAAAELSFSTLKRLKTYLRNTCGQERLVGLTLLIIYPEIEVEVAEVINRFAAEPGHRL